jgi:hypothetical protein
LLGQAHQVLALDRVGDSVEIAEVTNVPEARAAVACLHPAYLGGRAEQLPGDLIDGHASFGPERPQQGPQLAAPHGRITDALLRRLVSSDERHLTTAPLDARQAQMVTRKWYLPMELSWLHYG